MAGPYSYGPTTTMNGQPARLIARLASTDSGGKVPLILYVSATGAPLPWNRSPIRTAPADLGHPRHRDVLKVGGEATNEKARPMRSRC